MASAPDHKLSILVVEDEEMVLGAICLLLEGYGHRVQGAANGKIALALFRPNTFDIVITDLDMPGMKGDELAKTIKTIDSTQPVIMITAHTEFIMAGQNLIKGIDCLLGKPFQPESLQKAIASVFASRHPP